MKKLFLFSAMLFLFAACSKDEPTSTEQPDLSVANAPHFYGMAMLDNEGPATRGVADKMKVWSRPMAKDELTVKFLNGDPAYQQSVKEIASEWEEATAGVRFHYVAADQEAMIRIGFDYVRGMRSSWSYTGTDLLSLVDRQTEPTMHFAEWRRASDAQKRSDVLRAFGQTLGLELEYRHPDFDPGWKVDENGQIDEQSIRDYWEYELAEFISWEELKKMVLDPINATAKYVAKTDKYDPESVMNWPFYEEIASALDPIKFDSDYKTELSKQDKSFIASLYGDPEVVFPPITEIDVDLIEFDYTGSSPKFALTTTKKLKINWDADGPEDVTYIEAPSGIISNYPAISHTYNDSKKRRIVVSEVVEVDKVSLFSSALTSFNLYQGGSFRDIRLERNNKNLKTFTVKGGWAFIWQLFDFASQPYLKELYLIETQGSRVTVANCPNLEVLATSPSVWKPLSIEGPQQTEATEEVEEGMFERTGPTDILPPMELDGWPNTPMPCYSLSDSLGMGIDLSNCKKLKTISLDNTQVYTLDFSGLQNLDYVYLSSLQSYIVGGGEAEGQYLLESLKTLPDRRFKATGLIVIRGIGPKGPIKFDTSSKTTEKSDPDTNYLMLLDKIYVPVNIRSSILDSINQLLTEKNWQIVWDSGCHTLQ